MGYELKLKVFLYNIMKCCYSIYKFGHRTTSNRINIARRPLLTFLNYGCLFFQKESLHEFGRVPSVPQRIIFIHQRKNLERSTIGADELYLKLYRIGDAVLL